MKKCLKSGRSDASVERRRWTTALALLSVAALVLAACGDGEDAPVAAPDDADEAEGVDVEEGEEAAAEEPSDEDYEIPEELNFMTGSAGGTWQAVGAALGAIFEREFPGVRVNVLPGGSGSNLLGLQSGEANIALSNAFTTLDAIAGNEPFDEPLDRIHHIVALQEQTFHMMVPVDSDVQSIADLPGKSLATLAVGSAGEQGVSDILAVYGLSYDDLSRVEHGGGADLAEMMQNNQVDVIANVAPMPASYYLDVTNSRDMRIIPVDEEELNTLRGLNPGYVPGVIPAGTYDGVDEDIPTFSTYAHVLVSSDLDDGFVRELVRVFIEHDSDIRAVGAGFGDVTPENMARDVGAGMHPAAEELYLELGLL
jgi:uncharacterized protein